ncbi:MAG: glucosaminidase domain-containing protein [Bacilli bacterium]
MKTSKKGHSEIYSYILVSFIITLLLLPLVPKMIKFEHTETSINSREFQTESYIEELDPIVYDGLTKSELITKINKSLNSTVSGKGELFALYALEKGVDPYTAVAIMLQETGCKWTCSTLVRACNNVGGQKGTPSCGRGAYKRYSTIDEGIKGFIDNLANNYYKVGLNTPNKMEYKYAGGSKTWANAVNKYLISIKTK